jgi:hypothetical protein
VLVPIVWSTGTGSEVMQRVAVPMIGGMISSTILTLIVIPAVYALIKGYRLPSSVKAASTEERLRRVISADRRSNGSDGEAVPADRRQEIARDDARYDGRRHDVGDGRLWSSWPCDPRSCRGSSNQIPIL